MQSTDTPNSTAAPLLLPRAPPQNVKVQLLATLRGHKDRVWCARWCPTAPVLATCSGDATVQLWAAQHNGTSISATATAMMGTASPDANKASSWHCIQTVEGEHSRTIRHVSWSPSGTYLACASFDHTATVWRRDVESGAFAFEVEGVLDGHESEVKCVEWATDSTLITCSRDHTAWIWERADEGEYECGGVLTGHVQDVKHCQFLLPQNDGDVPLAVTCSYDDTIKVWAEGHHQDDWQCTQTLTAHTATVWVTATQRLEVPMEQMRLAQERSEALPQPLLCSGSDDLSVIFWKRNGQGKFVEAARASGFAERSLFDLDWAPHNTAVLACASGDDSVTLLGVYEDGDGVHTCTLAHVPNAHASDVNTVAFAADGALSPEKGGLLLATAGDDRVVRLWTVTAEIA